MKNNFTVVFLILILSSISFAQVTNEYNKSEFFVGYSSYPTVDDEFFVLARGFTVSGAYNFKRRIGLKGDVSIAFDKEDSSRFVPGFDNPTNAEVSYKRRDSIYSYVGGIQLKNNSTEKKVKPFAHFMAGVGQQKIKVTNVSCTTASNCTYVPIGETNTGLAVVIGGGLDIKVNKKIDIRVLQFDLFTLSYKESPARRDGFGSFRFGAGIVFK